MEICFANDDDKIAVKELWRYCFDDDDDYSQYFFDKRYKKQNNLIYKDDDGEVVTSLMLNQYALKVGGGFETQTSYIVGVSSVPHKRGLGHMSKLIRYALRHEKSLGRVYSVLMAIDSRIYDRYGFANACYMYETTMPLARIDAKPQNEIKITKCDYKNMDELDELVYYYEQKMRGSYLYFKRDREYFLLREKELELEGFSVYLAREKGKITGYMIFTQEFPGKKEAVVKEIFADSKSVYDAFFAMIKSHYTRTDTVVIHEVGENFIKKYLVFDNKASYKFSPFMMVRILDVREALRHSQIKADMDISVKDDIIDENNGIFSLTDYRKKSVPAKADLELEISELTSLILGQLTLDDIFKLKNMEVPEKKFKNIRNLFAKKVNWFNDYV